MLRSVNWWLVTDVSIQPACPIFNSEAAIPLKMVRRSSQRNHCCRNHKILNLHNLLWGAGVVQPMKAYGGSRGTAPLILKLRTRWKLVDTVTPRPFTQHESITVPTEQEAEWVPEPVGKFRMRIRFLNLRRCFI